MKLQNYISNYILKALAITTLFTSTSLAEEQKDKTHIALIVGTHHYSPQKTMPAMKVELERLGFKVSLVNPAWNPEKGKKGLPGLEVLQEADLAVFFLRFLKLQDNQLNHIISYVKSGKPVVGLRTSAHAFNYPEGHAQAALNTSFGTNVLGTPYLIHLTSDTELEVVESEQKHPILTGISGTWKSPGTLYITKLEEHVKPLVSGTGNSKKVGKITNMFGTHDLQKQMTDTVAWTWENKYGGKTFTTTLGHTGDFAHPLSMRLIVNGIHWAAGHPVPSAETQINPIKRENSKKKKK